MVFYLVAGGIIVVCIAWLASIVVPKFPQIALIDTESIPAERDAKKKKAIIQERVSRKTAAFGRSLAAALTSRFERMREAFRASYRRMLAAERQFRKEPELGPAEVREKIATLLAEAARLADTEDKVIAERKYIEVIALDPKNAEAYHGLAALYAVVKRHEQARETLEFLVRMLRKERGCRHESGGAAECPALPASHAEIAKAEVELGLAAEAVGDRSAAKRAYARAVALEPNPRHLDLLLDACILEGDKKKAKEVFALLSEVNPENNKLPAFAERIGAMPEPAPDEGRRTKKKQSHPS